MAIKQYTTTIGEAITWANEQIMDDVRSLAAVEEGKAEKKLAEWKKWGELLSFAVHGSMPGDDGEPY
jgi:hypothetical protein